MARAAASAGLKTPRTISKRSRRYSTKVFSVTSVSSVNYRSVVVLGTAKLVADEDEKAAVLESISEQILPGRWADIRWPNRKELKAATVLKLAINEASAKIRTGPPLDDEEDYALKCWAGVMPLKIVPGAPVADARLRQDTPVPDYARKFPRRGSSK